MAASKKLSLRDLRQMAANGQRIVCVTAYDACFGRLADEAGADLILVGDSLGMVMLGYRSTLQVTLEQSLHHSAAVTRAVKRALVVGDMPFLSYQCGEDDAVRNAGRFLQEAGCDAVKIEGGRDWAPLVRRLTATGIPVMCHIGLMPQKVLANGGYRIHGRGNEAEELLADARALAEAGAFAIVLEGMVKDLSRQVTEALDIPTIGIGAGAHCDGQIQVIHDILGLFEDFVPKHTKRYAMLAESARDALRRYGDEVRGGDFPTDEQSFQ